MASGPRRPLSTTGPECPTGHFLSRWRNRADTLVCDGPCGKPLAIREWRWSCSLCDFDYCEVCAGAGTDCKPAGDGSPASCEKIADDTPSECPMPPPAEAPMRQGGAPTETPLNPAMAIHGTPSFSPAITATAREGGSWVYMPHGLDSIRKELPFPASETKAARPSTLQHDLAVADSLGLHEGVCLPVHEMDADILAQLPSGELLFSGQELLLPQGSAPDLSKLGLPPAVAARLQARRDWLQQLFQLELQRESRVDSGGVSAFEAACGVLSVPPATATRKQARFGVGPGTALWQGQGAALDRNGGGARAGLGRGIRGGSGRKTCKPRPCPAAARRQVSSGACAAAATRKAGD